jgi:recombinational DNA repair ATPase RecF
LGRINVLCGKNNTGKSTLLEAASNEKTVCLGLTPDSEFVESLLKANNTAVDNDLTRAGHLTRLPKCNGRVVQVESGKVTLIAGDEVLAKARCLLKEHKP